MKAKKLIALTLATGAVAAPLAVTAVHQQEDHNIVSVQEEVPTNHDDGLTDWAITGIAVSSFIVALGIGYGAWYYYKKNKKEE